MHDQELRKAFYKLIEPIVSQFTAFFEEEDGDFNNCIESLRDVFTYLMTDEYEQMSAYIAKLGEELGVKFVKDKDMLSLDEFRYRVLIRENLHNFFIQTKTHFKDVLQIDILEKTPLDIRREKHRIAAKK